MHLSGVRIVTLIMSPCPIAHLPSFCELVSEQVVVTLVALICLTKTSHSTIGAKENVDSLNRSQSPFAPSCLPLKQAPR